MHCMQFPNRIMLIIYKYFQITLTISNTLSIQMFYRVSKRILKQIMFVNLDVLFWVNHMGFKYNFGYTKAKGRAATLPFKMFVKLENLFYFLLNQPQNPINHLLYFRFKLFIFFYDLNNHRT